MKKCYFIKYRVQHFEDNEWLHRCDLIDQNPIELFAELKAENNNQYGHNYVLEFYKEITQEEYEEFKNFY